MLPCWVYRNQHDVITYIQEENRVLKSKLKGKRIRSPTMNADAWS